VKKFIKTAWFVLLFVLVFMLLCCFPFAQKLIVKCILTHYFDIDDVRMVKMSVGPSGLRAKNVYLRYDDLSVRFANLNVKWRLKDWFTQRIFNVENATLDGLTLSVENEPKDVLYFEKKKERISVNFDLARFCDEFPQKLKKISSLCQLPIAIGKLSMSGSFDMYEKILGDFSLDVANFAKGKTASINFKFDSDFMRQLVGRLKIFGRASIGRDMSGTLESIGLNSSIFSKDSTMKILEEFSINGAYNRSKSANNLLHVAFVDEQNSSKILDASCNFDENTKNASFQADVTVTNSVAKYFVLGTDLNPFSCHLYSTGEYNIAQSKGLIKSNIEATFSRKFFDQALPELKDDLKFKFISSFGVSGDVIEIQSISGELGDVGNRQVSCSVELMDKHRFSRQNNSLLKSLNGLVLGINVNSMDTSIFGTIFNDWRLSSMVSGRCILAFNGNRLNIFSNMDKVHLSSVGLMYGGDKIIDRFKCSFEPRIAVGDVIRCDIIGLTCTDGNGIDILQGDFGFALDKKSCSCSGCLVCVLASLLEQPIFKNDLKLSSGLATCNFNLVQNEATCAGSAELKVKAVAYSGSKSPLNGNVKVTLESAVPTENEIKFNIDGKLHNEMDSDVSISGIIVSNSKEGSNNNTRTDVRSSTISLSDIATVYKLFAINKFNTQEGFFEKKISTPSDVSLWDEFFFDASFKINALYVNDIQLCSNLSCTLKVDPKMISLPDIVCSVLDAPLLASYSIMFSNDGYSSMYNVKTCFSLSDLSASKCMLLFNFPPRVLTGIFSANGSFSASRSALRDVLVFPNMQGKVDIVGVNGNILPMELLNNEQKGLLGLAGVAGSLLNVNITNDLIQIFGDIPYEKISISMIRQDSADIILDSLVIMGENLRIIASGAFTGSNGVPFRDYNLRLESQIGTKNDLAEIFNKFGWSTGMFDYYGYQIGPRFNIYGTIGNPDLSEVKTLLASASSEALMERAKNTQPSIISPEILLKIFQE
jgi:hypothetical protein